MEEVETPIVFLDKHLSFVQEPDYNWYNIRESNIISEAIGLNVTHLLVDHYKQSIFLCSYNPEISNILGGVNGNRKIDDSIITDKIPSEFRELFLNQIQIINDSIRNRILGDDKYYYFTFSIPMLIRDSAIRKITFKAVPYQFTNLKPDATPWLTYYLIVPTSENEPEHLILHSIKNGNKLHFVLRNINQSTDPFALLSDSDLDIIKFTSDGDNEEEISSKMNISVSHLKTKKYSLMLWLKCTSAAQAISILRSNKII